MIPAITLLLIVAPSLKLLYSIDSIELPDLSLRVLGHQWYWEYRVNGVRGIRFESYMVPEEPESLRLLDVDNRVILPTLSWVRAIVRSVDVLHSWALPSLNLKVDAVPGRLNQLNIIICKRGVTYGQCSEICGVNHRFMPIVLERVPFRV